MSGAAQGAPGPARPGVRTEEPGWQERSLGLEEGLGFRLSRLARVMRAAWAAQLADLGLTPAQAAILRGAAEHPESSIRCLARLLGADAMSVKRGADELERRGLLASGSLTGDRRPRILQLGDRGRELLGQIDTLVWQQEQVFGILGPAQRRHLTEALTVLEATVGVGATTQQSACREMTHRLRPEADRTREGQ